MNAVISRVLQRKLKLLFKWLKHPRSVTVNTFVFVTTRIFVSEAKARKDKVFIR